MFKWPGDLSDEDAEKQATAISGAFLFPKDDAIRELGVKRTSVAKDMLLVAKEYGISMMLLVTRAKLCGILSESAAKNFFVVASQMGWRTAEPSRISPEHPTLFEQLVCRAVNEEEISVQRGAELMHRPYTEILSMRQFSEA